MAGPLPYLDGAALARLVPPADAAQAIRAALRCGLDAAAGPVRTAVPVAAGELLLMPAESAGAVGVKITGVAPANPARGLPRISAVYLLLDPVSLLPVALLDGTALTSLRTPAVSAVAVVELAGAGPHSLLLLGTGPQARGHVDALRAAGVVARVAVGGRDHARTSAFAASLVAEGLDAGVAGAGALESATLIVCATDARTPLFDGEAVRDDACVVAVGSHEPGARELDEALLRHASVVVVEDRATALREAGDVVLAVQAGALDPDRLVELADLVHGRWTAGPGPRVFKSVGMAWEDLAVAQLAHRRWVAGPPGRRLGVLT